MAKRRKIAMGEKVLRCECGRMEYLVNIACKWVICCHCVAEGRTSIETEEEQAELSEGESNG